MESSSVVMPPAAAALYIRSRYARHHPQPVPTPKHSLICPTRRGFSSERNSRASLRHVKAEADFVVEIHKKLLAARRQQQSNAARAAELGQVQLLGYHVSIQLPAAERDGRNAAGRQPIGIQPAVGNKLKRLAPALATAAAAAWIDG